MQGVVDSIPGWGVKIPHVSRPKNKNIKQKRYCNKFNKDFLKQSSTFKQIKKKKIMIDDLEDLIMKHWLAIPVARLHLSLRILLLPPT